MNYLGDYEADSTVYSMFSTNDASGGRVEPNSAFEAADIRIYKNGSATQRSSESGYTMTSPFDSMVGVQFLSIDLSDNTDAGFYAAGNDYTVVLYPDETVDGQNVSKVLFQFSIENRYDSQTGDSFARLGAPAGASVSADISTIDTVVDAIKAQTDNLPSGIKKNTALSGFPFIMIDSADDKSGKTGLTVTARRSIDGGAFGSCTNSVTEIGNGAYKIDLAAADLNGDTIILRFDASGANDSFYTIKTDE